MSVWGFFCNGGYHISFTVIAAGPSQLRGYAIKGPKSHGGSNRGFTQKSPHRQVAWLAGDIQPLLFVCFVFALFGHQMVHLFSIIYSMFSWSSVRLRGWLPLFCRIVYLCLNSLCPYNISIEFWYFIFYSTQLNLDFW